VVVLCLGSLTADPAIGQPPQSGSHAAQSGFDAEKGRALYTTYCSSCHGANGEGRQGTYPPLKGSGVVTKADATKHIHVVLDGLQGGRAGGVFYADPMPAFSGILDDANIADIIDYERMGESRETRDGGPSDRGARPFQMTRMFRLKDRTHLETGRRLVSTGT
jgi:mono/diheme cytochrome c family protein